MITKKGKLDFNATEFDNPNVLDEDYSPIMKHGTTCCSLAMLSAKNYHTYNEIKDAIEEIKKESNGKKWHVSDRSGGEQNVVCVVTEHEPDLEKNLKKLGFSCLSKSLRRRLGYPNGLLKLYLLTFCNE